MVKLISGAWEKIIFVNYTVDPSLLAPLVPRGTTLSFYKNKCFVTLAGFVFSNIKVLGLPVPFHKAVPEINLRFYVTADPGDEAQKGVVFVQETISRGMMAWMANI